jgi:hypothetical protein
MPRTFVDNAWLSTGVVVTAPPMTFSAWVRTADIANFGGILTAGSGSSDHCWAIYLSGSTANVRTRATSAEIRDTAAVGGGLSNNAWHHIAGRINSSTSQAIFVNGVKTEAAITATSPSGVNAAVIGAIGTGGTGLEFNGQLCEIAIWNMALSDSEVVELAGGLRAKWMQVSALQSYVVIDGTSSPEPDFVGARTWAITGTLANYTTDGPVLHDPIPIYEQVAYRWRANDGSLFAP